MGDIVAVCCVVGAFVIGASLFLEKGIFQTSPDSLVSADVGRERYGYRLIAKTPELMGPDVPDPSLRYTGNRLSCGSCHLHEGDDPVALSLNGAIHNYPKFSARTAAIRTLEIRINECMTRSMNGKPLPDDSPQMIAIKAWVRDMAARDTAASEGERKAVEPAKFHAPDRAANVTAGKRIFEERCATCHGYDGAGRLADTGPIHGYVFPALWGPDSFNTGAGMHRLLTAAPFIKARMPLGDPDLTDDEAYDVAAYVNAKPRPEMANLEADFPDKRTKLIDAPYPPYVDPFPIEQHRLGPFQPIEAYYKNLRASAK